MVFVSAANRQKPPASGVSVVSTFYPLAHIAEQIGGEFVSVTNVTPAGAEPHEYEPTSQDIIGASTADIFLMNGGGLDTWAEKIESELAAKGVRVVNVENIDARQINRTSSR